MALPDDTDGKTVQVRLLWQFSILQRRFVDGLPARWAVIALALQSSDEQREALHRLAGAAGSYGYEALSESARIAECCNDAAMGHALSIVEGLLRKTCCVAPSS